MTLEPWVFSAIISLALFGFALHAKSGVAKIILFTLFVLSLLTTAPMAMASAQFWMIVLIAGACLAVVYYLKRKKKRKDEEEKKNGGNTNNFFFGDQRQP